MNREDVGEYFRHGCEIYQAFSYIDQPALELRNIKTGERIVVVIDSPISMEYHKLCEEKQEKEIEDLKEEVEYQDLWRKEYLERIDKAIELLENNYLYYYGSEKRPVVFEDNYIQELYDILKGEENEK